MLPSNIAIIPARGGSKRLPGKNIRDFLGKPIIAYTIEASIQCKLFDEIMVSTDDPRIAEVAIRYGANVPFMRSKVNSSDTATTLDVLHEVLEQYISNFNNDFKYACCLYPTSPLIRIADIIEGYERMVSDNFDSVFPVVPFSYPVWRGLDFDGKRTKMLWPEYMDSRSQDLRRVYHDAGQWYWLNCKKIVNSLFTNNSGSIVLSELEVQDIDTQSDWSVAELKFKLLNGR